MIRDAGFPEDLELVRTLFREYVVELAQDLAFQGFEAELSGLPGRYGPPRGVLLLWEDQGCVALRDLGEGVCEMKRLYIRPDARRGGVGRQLATAIIARGQAMGYSSMVLDTLDHMVPAIRLYESVGFKPCPPYYDNPLTGVVYLELRLAY